MKKMMTLLVTVAVVSTASAQYRTNEQRDFGYDKGNYGWNKKDDNRNGYYSFTARERDLQIAQINRQYDKQVREVRNRWFVSRFKKEQMIAGLEQQRRDEIKRVYARYNDRSNRGRDNNGRWF